METSYSFSYDQPEPPAMEEEWVLSPHTQHQLSLDKVLIRSQLSDASHVVTHDVYQALTLCDRFKTLEAHASYIVKNAPALKDHESNVVSVLKQIADQGLFISKTRFIAGLSGTQEEASQIGPIKKFYIRTCDRPDALRRLITDLADTAADASVTIIDNSRNPENVQWNMEIAGSTDFECRYFGHREQQQYIEQLIELCPGHSSAIRFLLDSDEHENVTTPGLPLNFILLLSIGSRFLLMDDDITLDAHTSPDADDRLQLSSQGRKSTLLPNDIVWQQFPSLEIAQGLQQINRLLGSTLGEWIQQQDVPGTDISGLASADLTSINEQSSIVIATCGTLGDPGSNSNYWVFDQDIDTLKLLPAKQQEYEALLTDRNAWVGSTGLSLQPRYALMTTTITAIDNTQLIPPTTPAYRNEDYLLGSLIQFIHPASLKADMPWAVPHLPQPRRQWEQQSTQHVKQTGIIQFLANSLVQHGSFSTSRLPASRLETASAILDDLATADQRKLAGLYKSYITERRIQLANRHQQTLKNIEGLNEFLERDLKSSIARNSQASVDQAEWAIYDLGEADTLQTQLSQVQALAASLSEGLKAWPDLREAARTCNKSAENALRKTIET